MVLHKIAGQAAVSRYLRTQNPLLGFCGLRARLATKNKLSRLIKDIVGGHTKRNPNRGLNKLEFGGKTIKQKIDSRFGFCQK